MGLLLLRVKLELVGLMMVVAIVLVVVAEIPLLRVKLELVGVRLHSNLTSGG